MPSTGGASRQHWGGERPALVWALPWAQAMPIPLAARLSLCIALFYKVFLFPPGLATGPSSGRGAPTVPACPTHCTGLPPPLCRRLTPRLPPRGRGAPPGRCACHSARLRRPLLSTPSWGEGVKEWVVFQKWRSVEMDGTLGLGSTASHSKEWPMTLIAVHCPTARASRASNAGKQPGEPSATSVRTPSVLRQVFCSTLATAGAC